MNREVTVSISTTKAVPAVLRSLGADPAEVLTEVGLHPELYDDPGNVVSYVALGRLIAHCVDRTGCKHFGLLVGQRGGLDSLGIVGLLLRNSKDVGEALRNLVAGLHLQVRGAVVGFEVSGGTAILSYDAYETHVDASEQINDGALAEMFNILKALCGSDWRPIAVLFARAKPADVGPFREFFRAPLFFDAEHNSLEFSATWLHHRLPDADPEVRKLIDKEIKALESRSSNDLPEQVRGVLRTALPGGRGTATQVAALFAMHSRTLTRRLNGFGTGFHELVDEIGYEIARQMLELSDVDVAEIAAALNYADSSAFTRAFRRWSGTTPARWRAECRARKLQRGSIT